MIKCDVSILVSFFRELCLYIELLYSIRICFIFLLKLSTSREAADDHTDIWGEMSTMDRHSFLTKMLRGIKYIRNCVEQHYLQKSTDLNCLHHYSPHSFDKEYSFYLFRCGLTLFIYFAQRP